MLSHTYHSDTGDAKKALPNYFSILSGDRKANFRACKQLSSKVEKAKKMLKECMLCEHKCGVDRIKRQLGFCKVLESRITSEFIHLGEETELVPSYTIFFAGCNFKCVYCQNWDISQNPRNGVELTAQMVARLIESHHARNVNWVGGEPTPNLPFILEVLTHLEKNIPQVWNSNMYLTKESMKLLDGVIDVYLADFKYGNDKCASRLSKADRYMEVVSKNLLTASKQCEMIVRHLMLPTHYECCTKPILEWISEHLGDKVRVNLMNQYRPEYQAFKYEEINSLLSKEEYDKAKDYAIDLGLNLTD